MKAQAPANLWIVRSTLRHRTSMRNRLSRLFNRASSPLTITVRPKTSTNDRLLSRISMRRTSSKMTAKCL